MNLDSYHHCITAFPVNHKCFRLLRPRNLVLLFGQSFTHCLLQNTRNVEVSGGVVLPWKYDHLLWSWDYKGCAQLAVVDGVAGRVRMLSGIRWWCGSRGLREHFRETHLFTLSSPDGQKSLSQDPADCLHWEYTQIVKAQTQRSHTEDPPALVCTAQTTQTVRSFPYLLHFPLILDPVAPKPKVLPQLQAVAWGRNRFSSIFIRVFTALSPRRGKLRIFKDDTDNSVCLLLWRERFQLRM